ncbi:MAG: amino acid adenylation domain protein, partial [Pedosphaera sp.]|nr:amino acid adenylation domain protein [Pedosphaera sp.]
SESSSLGSFLAGLDLKVVIEALSDSQLTRTSQLTQRTNQFNFTTRRRTESELQAIRQNGKQEVFTVSVSDRFGDYGLVGAMILQPAANALVVDSFLLSCRVLGRGVEHQMLARLGRIALRHGLEVLDVHFLPTTKNRPAFNFLESVAAQYRQSLSGGYVYRLPAELVVGLKLDPNDVEAHQSETPGPARAIPKPEAVGTDWKNRCRRIALEGSDARMILQKIEQRSQTRAEDQGTYVAPRTEMEEMLCKIWEEFLRVDRVGIKDNFFESGGHSLLAVRLFAEIEKQTGRKLPLVTIFQHSTIERLAATLSEQSQGARSSMVAIQPHGTKPPLFLIHGAGGDVLWGYANLSAHLGTDQPVYGIKSRALNGAEEFTSLEEMGAFYVRQVCRFQKRGPYQLGGYCFGGNVAYEMARQLQAQGEEVALVALLDSAPANGSYEKMKWWQPSFALKFMINSYFWLDDFLHTEAQERRTFVLRKTRAWRRKLAGKIFNRAADPTVVDLEEVIDVSKFPEHELRLWQLHLNTLAAHVSRPYSGRVTLFRTRGQPLFCSLEDDFGWGKLVGNGVDIRLVPGSHESIFLEPAVQSLAEQLNSCLARVTTAGPTQEAMKSA